MVGLVALSGCMPAPVPAVAYAPAAQGLVVSGTGLEVSFGRAQPGALAAIEKLAGPVTDLSDVAGCGTVATHRDGSQSIYRNGVFVGWRDDSGRTAGRVCV